MSLQEQVPTYQKDKDKILYIKPLETEKMPMHIWCTHVHILKTEREKKGIQKTYDGKSHAQIK